MYWHCEIMDVLLQLMNGGIYKGALLAKYDDNCE